MPVTVDYDSVAQLIAAFPSFDSLECQKSEECATNAYCDWFACKCKDELIKNGKECLPGKI